MSGTTPSVTGSRLGFRRHRAPGGFRQARRNQRPLHKPGSRNPSFRRRLAARPANVPRSCLRTYADANTPTSAHHQARRKDADHAVVVSYDHAYDRTMRRSVESSRGWVDYARPMRARLLLPLLAAVVVSTTWTSQLLAVANPAAAQVCVDLWNWTHPAGYAANPSRRDDAMVRSNPCRVEIRYEPGSTSFIDCVLNTFGGFACSEHAVGPPVFREFGPHNARYSPTSGLIRLDHPASAVTPRRSRAGCFGIRSTTGSSCRSTPAVVSDLDWC